MNHVFQTQCTTIQALLITAAKKDIRYYLNGVLFERRNGMATLVSTDGHRATAISLGSNAGPDVQFIVPTDVLRACKGKNDVVVTFDDQTKMVTVAILNGTFYANEINGTFPDYRRVINWPHGEFTGNPAVNPDYLADCKKQAMLMAGQKSPAPNFITFGENNNVLVDIGVPEFIGVVMPVRKDKVVVSHTCRPIWLN